MPNLQENIASFSMDGIGDFLPTGYLGRGVDTGHARVSRSVTRDISSLCDLKATLGSSQAVVFHHQVTRNIDAIAFLDSSHASTRRLDNSMTEFIISQFYGSKQLGLLQGRKVRSRHDGDFSGSRIPMVFTGSSGVVLNKTLHVYEFFYRYSSRLKIIEARPPYGIHMTPFSAVPCLMFHVAYAGRNEAAPYSSVRCLSWQL